MIIFLHAKGNNKDSLPDVLDGFDEPYFSFNAPFEYRNGFFWFDKETDLSANLIMVIQSVNFIVKQIKKYNDENTITPQEITLIGHSQGGIMAILASKFIPVGKIITLGSDVHKGIEVENGFSLPPILWFEAEIDNSISAERRASYQKLLDKSYKLDYHLAKGSTHENFSFKYIKELF